MRVDDRRSPEATAYRRWYWTTRWRAIAKAQIAAHPLCARCQREGRITPATVCHHVEPHKGDETKFWAGPFESSCKPCHDGAGQFEDRRGFDKRVGADGWPTDPKHPANR